MTTTSPSTAPSLARLLHARSVVVVGASATRDTATGNQVIRNLRLSEFSGTIHVLHPSGAEIEGITALHSLDEAGPLDAAVIAVGPRAVEGVLREVAAAGVASAVVMSVGLDDAQRAALRDVAAETGIAVHGPNCMGVINVASGLMLWADEGILTGLPAGNVALVSQSGSGAIFVARSMAGVGFSHVVSTGDETVSTTAHYVDLLADDEATDVIGLIVESVADASALQSAVRHARAAGKPIVALKVGRSAAGAQATIAHTGAVVADGALVEALFRRLGVPLVHDYDELAAALEVLAHLHGRRVGSGRTGIVTISGGQAALAADLADERGVDLAVLSDDTRAALEEILPGLIVNNPLDAGGSVYAEEDAFERALEILADAPEVDVVMAITDSQATLNAVEISYEDDLIEAVRVASSTRSTPFVVASSSSVSLHPSRVAAPGEAFTVVRGIGNALTAVRAAADAFVGEGSVERPADLPSPARVAELRDAVARFAGGPVEAGVVRELMTAYGVPLVRSEVVTTLDEALVAADDLGYPLVAKIDSPDIAHKSEVGGVIVGIDDAGALRTAYEDIREAVVTARPDARVTGVELQPLIGESIEALIGVIADRALGAAVVVGTGGVNVELYRDVAQAYAPVGSDEARAVLDSTALSKVLAGYRNLNPVVDAAPFVDAVVRTSWMAADLHGVVAEFDANPVLIDVHTSRVRLIDALLIAAEQR